MPKNSFAEMLAAARQMVAGLSLNAAQVAERGLTAEFTTHGQELIERAQSLNAEQETLKAALKLKTAELDATVTEIKAWQSEASKTVKLVYRTQPEIWIGFGLTAKR